MDVLREQARIQEHEAIPLRRQAGALGRQACLVVHCACQRQGAPRDHARLLEAEWGGQAYMVSRLPSSLRSMLGATCKMPDVLFTYRGLASFIYQLVPSVLSTQLLSMPMGLLPGRDTTGSGKPQILLTSCCMKRQWHGLGAT